MKRLKDRHVRITSAVMAMIVMSGCVMGPNYQRPAVDTPSTFRAAATETADLSLSNSLADLGWREVFTDPQLQTYVTEALTNSWDIKIAAARVLQAEAVARVTRSRSFPTVGVGGEWNSVQSSDVGITPTPVGVDREEEYSSVYVTMASYELDLWGRIRRAKEASLARLLASEEAQRTVRQTLIAAVATAYLALLELDYELEISKRTFDVRTKSLALTTAREEGGVASMQDVYQSQVLLATAEATIADIHRRIEQKENELCVLLGRNPGVPERGEPFLRQKFELAVPPGLPSDLIERRPDIRAAEQQLVAANADIGQAKAAYFPRLALTGIFGYQALEFSDLFSSESETWQFGPVVSLPIFTGGALKGRLRFVKASFEESVAVYQKTVQDAFREVSDSLIAYQRTREFTAKQGARTQANRNAADLALVRYEGGVTSYLEVLYNEQELFTAELSLAQSRLGELISVVTLYRTLGGGWENASTVARE